jgi:hypothetical protein
LQNLASDRSGTHIGIMKIKSARKPKKGAPAPLLQKWHTNDIYKAIETAGLDPRQFDLNDSGVEVRVKHKWTESCFIIGGNLGHFVGRYVFGNSIDWPYEAYSWDAMLPRVQRWLQFVKHDLGTPDLWAELKREGELLRVGSNEVAENAPFTPEEQKAIAGRLDELAKYVRKTHSLSQVQMRPLEEKLDYLVDASGRLGRKDWLNAFIGVTLAFMLSVALAPESARTMFLTFLRAIGHLYPELPID